MIVCKIDKNVISARSQCLAWGFENRIDNELLLELKHKNRQVSITYRTPTFKNTNYSDKLNNTSVITVTLDISTDNLIVLLGAGKFIPENV